MRKNDAFRIPDIINRQSTEHFTQIPNEMLRNPALSAKAKGILCLLMSNKDGWYSYMATILGMMSDGRDSIRSGLQELQEAGYLKKMRYRDKDTKRMKGTLWIYTASVGEFPLDEKWVTLLDENDLELVEAQIDAVSGKPTSWKATVGKPATKNTKEKNTKGEEVVEGPKHEVGTMKRLISPNKEKGIVPTLFEKFWSSYPKKADKGAAKTAWEKLCRKENRPSWKEVSSAILAQKKSERWQNPKYIPHATTWLNQQRWLDDPAEMKNYGPSPMNEPLPGHATRAVDAERILKRELGSLAKTFASKCVKFATTVFSADQGSVLLPLIDLYKGIVSTQKSHMTKALEGILPGPITLIENYLDWVDGQDWISAKTPKLLNQNHTLFQRFCREEARRDAMNRHPLTGDYC